MQHQIGRHALEQEISLTLYFIVLARAAVQSDQFLIGIQTSVYDNSEDFKRFCSLGQVFKPPLPDDPLSKLFDQVFGMDSVRTKGIPNKVFVRKLTHTQAPARVITDHGARSRASLPRSGNGLCTYRMTTEVLKRSTLPMMSCEPETGLRVDPSRTVPPVNVSYLYNSL